MPDGAAAKPKSSEVNVAGPPRGAKSNGGATGNTGCARAGGADAAASTAASAHRICIRRELASRRCAHAGFAPRVSGGPFSILRSPDIIIIINGSRSSQDYPTGRCASGDGEPLMSVVIARVARA